jgi:DNA-binding transcriptional MerR regulator
MYIDLPEKRYYKIGEVAKAFGLNTSHIRFWEKEFDVLKPKKNKKGNRLFTSDDVKNLKLIYHLVKEKGFTLEGAKSKMKKSPTNVKNNHEIITRLEAIKEELINIKKQIDS